MSSFAIELRRATVALPFLGLAILCLREMDIQKMVAHQQPFLNSGKIEWSDGVITILPRFHYVNVLDDVWRGTTASFSPSTLGYDAVSSWHMFSFLNDMGPLYVVWILESSRKSNAWSPAYLPTLFAFAGQLLGLGFVAPLFYFLCLTVGSSTSKLVQSAAGRRLELGHNTAILPLILLLHTSEVFAAYLAADPMTRHYWTWAWQMTPLWLGMSNFVISKVVSRTSLRTGRIASPEAQLGVTSLISSGVWVYTAAKCEFPLSTVFLPDMSSQSAFAPHMRRALQIDELCVFTSSFLWLAYQFFDLHSAGLMGSEWLVPIAILPILTAFIGPGAAFATGWYWRERNLQSKHVKESNADVFPFDATKINR